MNFIKFTNEAISYIPIQYTFLSLINKQAKHYGKYTSYESQ